MALIKWTEIKAAGAWTSDIAPPAMAKTGLGGFLRQRDCDTSEIIIIFSLIFHVK